MAERKIAVKNDNNEITAEVRHTFGKGAARKMRVLGKIPAVVYGHGTAPQHLALPGHEVGLLLRKANAVLTIDIEGTTQLALVKDVQKDPVKQIIEHIDLIVIRAGEKVTVDVAIHIEGEPVSGTVANIESNTVSLEALATSIPERIIVSVEGAESGTQIFAKDLELPTGASLITDEDTLVINVVTPGEQDLGDEPVADEVDETPADAAE